MGVRITRLSGIAIKKSLYVIHFIRCVLILLDTYISLCYLYFDHLKLVKNPYGCFRQLRHFFLWSSCVVFVEFFCYIR